MSQADKLREYEKENNIKYNVIDFHKENYRNVKNEIGRLIKIRKELLKLIITSDNPDIHRKSCDIISDKLKELNKDEKVFEKLLNN